MVQIDIHFHTVVQFTPGSFKTEFIYDYIYLFIHSFIFIWMLLVLVSDPDDPFKLTEDTRNLGLIVCRGTTVVLFCPADGMEAIANPFAHQEAVI